MTGRGKWKRRQWKAEETTAVPCKGVQNKRRRRCNIVPITESVNTASRRTVSNEDSNVAQAETCLPQSAPVHKISAPTTSQSPVDMDLSSDTDSNDTKSECLPNLRSQDTVVINSEWPDVQVEDNSDQTLTPMPSVYSDLLSPCCRKESSCFHRRQTPVPASTYKDEINNVNQSPSGCELPEETDIGSEDPDSDSPALCSQDTVIINPAWHDINSEDDLEPLPNLTPMPSVYADWETSFRTNETIMIHRNLTLLLATTRIAISHDEDELDRLALDISRLKRGLHMNTIDFDRLSCRAMKVRTTIASLCD